MFYNFKFLQTFKMTIFIFCKIRIITSQLSKTIIIKHKNAQLVVSNLSYFITITVRKIPVLHSVSKTTHFLLTKPQLLLAEFIVLKNVCNFKLKFYYNLFNCLHFIYFLFSHRLKYEIFELLSEILDI